MTNRGVGRKMSMTDHDYYRSEKDAKYPGPGRSLCGESTPHGGDSLQLALGSCFTYFQHPFSRRKFFVDPKLREFFCNRFATERLAIPRERGKPAATDGRMGKTSG